MPLEALSISRAEPQTSKLRVYSQIAWPDLDLGLASAEWESTLPLSTWTPAPGASGDPERTVALVEGVRCCRP
jgi:hypothetical protein